jgi:hypothetical protein
MRPKVKHTYMIHSGNPNMCAKNAVNSIIAVTACSHFPHPVAGFNSSIVRPLFKLPRPGCTTKNVLMPGRGCRHYSIYQQFDFRFVAHQDRVKMFKVNSQVWVEIVAAACLHSHCTRLIHVSVMQAAIAAV